jgi:CRP/FNR family transcriptional regulator, cyclic AMP receptor protein
MKVDLPNMATSCRQIDQGHLKATFKFLADEEIEILCHYLDHRVVPANAILMAEGEPGDCMGFLVTGRLVVNKETSFAGKYILLAILDPGSMVGEIAVMDHCRRTATVTAMEESQLLMLTTKALNELLAREPLLGIKILRRIVQVLGLRLQGADDRLVKLL